MPRKRAYRYSQDGSWQYPTMPVSFVACCDCGLVHRHFLQITPDDFAVRGRDGKWRYGRRVRVKVSRDMRKTAQVRRGMYRRKELYKTKDGWYVIAVRVKAPRKRRTKNERT